MADKINPKDRPQNREIEPPSKVPSSNWRIGHGLSETEVIKAKK